MFCVDDEGRFMSVDDISRDRDAIYRQPEWVTDYHAKYWSLDYRQHRNYHFCFSPYELQCIGEYSLADADKYNFAFYASSLPFRVSHHDVSRLRIRKVSARLLNTKSVFINGTRVALPNEIYSETHSGFSGDVSVNMLGTLQSCIMPYWTIHGNEAQPITVLSVSVAGGYSI
jgi:hypothetical protein